MKILAVVEAGVIVSKWASTNPAIPPEATVDVSDVPWLKEGDAFNPDDKDAIIQSYLDTVATKEAERLLDSSALTRGLQGLMLDMENRIRALESRAPVDPSAFREDLKARVKSV